jgi:transcriptional regulator with XRE-family HTH domain
MRGLPVYSINLRRLFAWHLLSSQDVASLIGATEASISGWITGKRQPSGKYLTAIGDLFEVNPSKLFGETDLFGEAIANPDRNRIAEENIARTRRGRLEAL